jgi:hypothetical protein
MTYPWMNPYTPRQLHTIADQLDKLTKVRREKEAAGDPTTPDSFPVRFPGGHVGVVHWAPADLTSKASRARNNGEPPWRYILDLGPNKPHLGDFEPAPYGESGQTGTDGWVAQKMREMAKAGRATIDSAVLTAPATQAGRAEPDSAA